MTIPEVEQSFPVLSFASWLEFKVILRSGYVWQAILNGTRSVEGIASWSGVSAAPVGSGGLGHCSVKGSLGWSAAQVMDYGAHLGHAEVQSPV